jgi:hypothetical protein
MAPPLPPKRKRRMSFEIEADNRRREREKKKWIGQGAIIFSPIGL